MTAIQTSERKGKSDGVYTIVAHAGLVAVGYVENAGWSEDGILPTYLGYSYPAYPAVRLSCFTLTLLCSYFSAH